MVDKIIDIPWKSFTTKFSGYFMIFLIFLTNCFQELFFMKSWYIENTAILVKIIWNFTRSKYIFDSSRVEQYLIANEKIFI